MTYDQPTTAHHYHIQLGSILKIPEAGQEDLAYKDLVCTEEDKSNIFELITIMAESNKIQLYFKETHLRNIGSQIGHVHPLKFLATIFTNPRLKASMEPISEDSFKWGPFIKDLGAGLTRESIKGKLSAYISDFAKEINIAEEKIAPYFHARDWENFVFFLMQS